MNLLILPGNSIRNKVWADKAEEAFLNVAGISKVYKHYYRHWETNESINLDLDLELERITANFSLSEPYIVFAKSLGSILTVYSKSKGVLNPEKSVFVGMPIRIAEENAIPYRVEEYNVPTLVIQNTEDPITSSAYLKKKVDAKGNFTLIEVEGNTHEYNDFEFMKEKIALFLGV